MQLFLRFLTLLTVSCGLSAVSSAAERVFHTYSEIACLFETSTQVKGAEQPDGRYAWQMWRSKQEVEVYQMGSREGEAWTLDGGGGVMQSRILHPDRTEVVFNAMELKILGKPVNWSRCCSLVAPEFLQQSLHKTGTQIFLGCEVQEFKGVVGAQEWTVLWDPKDEIAVAIEIEHAGRISRTVLREKHVLGEQPWPRLRSRGYEQIAYTELGDNDTDPRIKRIMARLGIKCSHKSCSAVCLTPGPSIR